jgi:hypothetical protein
MAAIKSPSSTRNTPDQNHPSPALTPHARKTSFSHDELTPGVDLEHLIPVLLLYILRIPYPTPKSRVCNEDRYGLVLACDVGVGEAVGDEVSC